MIDLPLVRYVTGLLPKPEPRAHRDALFRCLLAGVRRIDEQVALDIASNLHCFDLVSWTFDFYGEHRDIGIDRDAIEDVIRQPEPTARDLAEAVNWRRRLARWMFSAADLMPFLIPHVADERVERRRCVALLRRRDDARGRLQHAADPQGAALTNGPSSRGN